MDDASLAAADNALFFLLQTPGQNHIRVLRRFGKKEIDGAEEFQLIEGLAREVRVRKRYHGIEACAQKRFDLTFVDRVHDFLRAVTRLRQFIRLDSPDPRHVLARGRIGELSLPRQLVALLSVFASALPIALAG